jgi:hypothetical protein
MKFKLATMAAAMLGAASAAQAADLGRPAPAAVDYVKVCDAYGAGFFYIPGGETCLRIDGYVRADYRTGDAEFATKRRVTTTTRTAGTVTSQTSTLTKSNLSGPFVWNDNLPANNSWFSRARALIHFDARTNTEFGLLRSYIEVYWTTSTGNFGGVSTDLDLAYVQWGGLTAGRAQSFYDYYTGYPYEMNFGDMASDTKTNLLGYTFAFGNGVSASVSIEDTTTNGGRRRNGVSALTEAASIDPVVGQPLWRQGLVYGGNKYPDVVANLLIAQAWGTAKLAVAAHHLQPNTTAIVTPGFNLDANGVAQSRSVNDDWGWAIQGSVEVNLPMIGPSTKAALQAAYGDGALSYVAGNFVQVAGTNIGADAVFNPNGNVERTTAWVIMGGFTHSFTPAWQFDFNAGYGQVDGYGRRDYDQLEIAGSLRWKPVAGLQIGLAAEYRDVNFSSGTQSAFTNSTTAFTRNGGGNNSRVKVVNQLDDVNAFVLGLRVQRNF